MIKTTCIWSLLCFAAFVATALVRADSCTWASSTTNTTYYCDIYTCVSSSNGSTYTKSSCTPAPAVEYCGSLSIQWIQGAYCAKYNCYNTSLTGMPSYTKFKCLYNETAASNCLARVPTTYVTCGTFDYSFNCIALNYSNSDEYGYCTQYSCTYPNGTQFSYQACSPNFSSTNGCVYVNTTWTSNNALCFIYYCNYTNGTSYYGPIPSSSCFYNASTAAKDCMFIPGTTARVSYTIPPYTNVCSKYNCLGTDPTLYTNVNCSESAFNESSCTFVNTTTITGTDDIYSDIPTNFTYICKNYNCSMLNNYYIHPVCTLTDPVCTISHIYNTTKNCEYITCIFKNGTIISGTRNCVSANCTLSSSTINDTYTCETYNCLYKNGTTNTPTICTPNIDSDSDSDDCSYVNTTSNSTYTCLNYNCSSNDISYISSDCIQNNNQTTGGNNTNQTNQTTTATLSGSIEYNMNFSTFDRQTGNLTFVNALATSLGIDSSLIRIIDIREGSVIFDYEIVLPTTSQTTLQAYANTINEIALSGGLNAFGAAANVIDVQNQVAVTPPTTNPIPASDDNGTFTPDSSTSNNTSESSKNPTGIIIGVVLGVAVIIGGAFVLHRYRAAKRAAHQEAGLSSVMHT